MKRFLVTALAGSALALAPFSAAASNGDDWQVFARCADAMHPVAVIDIRVNGMKYLPLAKDAHARFDRASKGLVVVDGDGTELATITQDAKTVTIRGGWSSYGGHDVDSARVFRTLDPTCARDERTITFKKPVIPSD
jgi:hypothetical protein